MAMTDEELARALQDEEDCLAEEDRALGNFAGGGGNGGGGGGGPRGPSLLVGTKSTYECGSDRWNTESVRLSVDG